MLITTTHILQGIEIKEYLGLVYAVKPDLFSVGSGEYAEKMLNDTMEPLLQSMQDKAKKAGANAVIGVQFAIEGNYVRAFGTAVKCAEKEGAV